jgi:hypothetical protein
MTNRVHHLALTTLAAAGLGLTTAGAGAADKDLIGMWTNGVIWGKANAVALDVKGELTPNSYGRSNTNERTSFAGQYTGGERFIIAEQDPGVEDRAEDFYPMYKPQYWAEVDFKGFLHKSDPTKEFIDPRWTNLPLGVPRLGPPSEIVPGRQDGELFFIYQTENQWRYIPTDCRKHDETLTYDVQYNGHSVGCWEGNTLVVTSVGFTDNTWIWRFGGIHSLDMKVIEKFTPNADGTRVAYQVIVEDPEVLLEPWDMGSRNLNRQKDPKAFLREDYPYNNPTVLGELGGGC